MTCTCVASYIQCYSIANQTVKLVKQTSTVIGPCHTNKSGLLFSQCLSLLVVVSHVTAHTLYIAPDGRAAHRGELGHIAPGPNLKGAPGGPMKGPLNTCLKDRYTLIEQSDINTLIEQSKYSSEEQCSKLINKEIWLVGEG